MRAIQFLLLFFLCKISGAQNFTFNRFSTEEGIGLSSNLVTSAYQDERGFIWVGTANGLHRFDGGKFVQLSSIRPGTEPMPDAQVYQVLPVDSGKLFLAFTAIREFGIFDPANFTYRKIQFATADKVPAHAKFFAWRDARGALFLNVADFGILQYNKSEHAFLNNAPFPLPEGWNISLHGVYDDEVKKQVWICADSGICVFDRRSGKMWNRYYNPESLPILENERVQQNATEIYIDRMRRFWIFGWPEGPAGEQVKYCLDSTGSRYLDKDTMGLNEGPVGFTVYNRFYETKDGNLWIYGSEALFNYNNYLGRFQFHRSSSGSDNININYENIYQVMEDRDGGIWVATDQGLYFTSLGSASYSVVNLMFDNKKTATYINDILEMPGGEYWFASWGNGIKSMDSSFKKTGNRVYEQAPPAYWPKAAKAAVRNTWCMSRQQATGDVWIGCDKGILIVHDVKNKNSRFLMPPEFNGGAIRYITEDRRGQMWLGTENGRLIRFTNDRFEVVMDIGSAIYKVFIDKQDWIWLSTQEKGLYAVHPVSGEVLQHYTKHPGGNSLYSNTGNDIEQLNDSTIVLGAGALNFINKNTRSVSLVTYKDGLPSNTVERLRTDQNGFLWIITTNGLSRYNPGNGRIMPYGKKDGIVLGEKTNAADLVLQNGYLMFAGSNAMIMFHPSVFSINTTPPPVTITDFKIFNQFQPIDSIMQEGAIRLDNNQNSISIFFASLSYIQRDRLTYYYKMEGLDQDWIKADKTSYVNYSLLPPGNYTFKIYCENIEGHRSKITTELKITILPPFWGTRWFTSTVLFFIALIIYAVHDMRVQRLMAVEKLRNRVARDLHDDMGSTLSTINILSAMAKSKMNNDPVKTTEYLSKITDNSQRMMDAMDDIVWSIKPSNDSMQKIVARMREFAINVLEPKDIELDFTVEDAVYDVKMNMESRRDFFLIFKEAVNNAAKYSRASRLIMKITLQQKLITLLVKDDGIGFDVAMADSGNGLGNIQKRADAMNGKVAIYSKAGEGTEVMVKIPIV